MARLSERAVQKLKPEFDRYGKAKAREVPDGLVAGLYCAVGTSGARSWVVRYRHEGKPRKLTLGRYPAIGLADARKLAREVLVRVATGEDPAAEKAAARRQAQAEPDVDRDLFENVAEAFLELYARRHCRPRTVTDYEATFRLHVLPHWRGRKIQDIARRDVADLFDRLVAGGLTTKANRAFETLRKLFGWCVERGIIETSPMAGMRAPVKETARERVLSDAEIAAIWRATAKMDGPARQFVRLLLLTGQRRSEVAAMEWTEIDREAATWTIPSTRAKNARAHVVPLSSPALAELDAVPNPLGGPLVFTTTGRTPLSGFSKIKLRLDRLVAAELGDDVEPWTLHDLRRTFVTGLAELGVSVAVAEKCINHVSGTFRGIVSVYQKHDFADEKRAAMDAWASHVLALAEGRPAANVVPLEAGRA